MLLYPSGREETEVVFPVRVTRFAFKSFYEITKSKRIFVENPDASWDSCFTILRDAVLYYRTGGLTEKIVQQIIREEGYEPRTYHPEYIALEGGNAGENAEAIADRIIRELITGGMSPAEKARVLHDWITTHARYSMKYDSPTGVLKYGEGHCESYATAYQMLLDKAGVENKLAMGSAGESRGTAEGHMWNLVRIGSVWLHVDCTWDDSLAGYDYFNLSDAENKSHRRMEFSVYLPPCVSSDYKPASGQETINAGSEASSAANNGNTNISIEVEDNGSTITIKAESSASAGN
jgi:hypothetical protein